MMAKPLLWQYRSSRTTCAGNELPASFCSSVDTRTIRIAFMNIYLLIVERFRTDSSLNRKQNNSIINLAQFDELILL